MMSRMKIMLFRQLLKIPFSHTWHLKRQFKVERQLIEGRHHANSPHRSIIHFSVNKAATTFTKNILSRCATENGIVPVNINGYAFNSNFPFLDHLTAQEMVRYHHIFKASGYLYTVFGGMVEGIQNLDEFLTVLIVRDPRDALTSEYFAMAYSHEPPRSGDKIASFKELRGFARRVGIDQYAIRESERVRGVYQRYLDLLVTRANVYITTYEEMISDFQTWLDDLLDYCELKISPQLKRQILEEAHQSRPRKENVSQHIRQALPGDHQRKLQAETIAHLNSVFSIILREFNYKIPHAEGSNQT
jgi:hypothetical protein